MGPIKRLRRVWLQHVLLRAKIPFPLWQHSIAAAPTLQTLDHGEARRLRQQASLFLHDKAVTGAGGLVVDPEMAVYVAAQACLLILNLDLEYFDGWNEVILYPDTFVVKRQQRDAAGVVHDTRQALVGESWSHGPLILSWADIAPGMSPHGHGSNVVLHEFAHKIDMLNGPADGLPPLHRGMHREAWTAAFSTAYEHLRHAVRQGHETAIDPYATTDPGEFFAVVTEVFFEEPEVLNGLYPDVYTQLRLFYRQDPLHRSHRLPPTTG